MAFEIGTAANHVDLFERLVTFLSTGLGAAENWQVLRHTGVSEIDASSFVVNWEPWTAFKGPYHAHANGWATAVGQYANSWLRWKMVQPFDIARLTLVGSATANQSPRDFTLQWSDDGINWTDRKVFTGVTWANNEAKEFTIDGTSPGAKSHWRIFVSANGGNTTSTVIRQVLLPEWQIYQDFNHARRPAVWFKAPGMTGFDPCYINFQLYDRPTNDYYNIAVTGCTGFVGAAQFDDQPGALTALAIPLWNQPIPYWFSGNGQRVIISAKVDTAYLSSYAGKMLPFGTPQQYPYPLLIGAPLPSASGTRYSDSAVNLPYKGNRTTLKLRKNDGSWIQPQAWPYSKTTTFRDTNGAYPLLPITLYDTSNTYGVLDGIHFVTGFGNAVENTVTVGTETHVVLQDVTRNGLQRLLRLEDRVMAYQTGVITSAADLVVAITDFAVANGWTANGNVLSKGGTYIRLTAPSASEVRIEGARNGNFVAPDLCGRHSRIYNTAWPASATYHLAAFDNPDTVWCTINFAVTTHQHIGFGTVEKYGNWAGGGWFHAQHTPASADGGVCSLIDGSQQPYYPSSPRECALFWSPSMRDSWNGYYQENAASNLHCELRGYVWEPPIGSTAIGVHCPTIVSPIHKYNPNVFNGQTVLTPFQLFLQNTDGHYMSIGHVGHLRFVRLTNYNPGDVIELGTDRWKLFPWHIKNAAYPDGKQVAYSDGNYSTGLLGVAVHYDGPLIVPALTGFYPTAFLQWTRDHLNVVPLDQLGDALYEDRRASAIPVGRFGPLTNNAPVDSSPRALAGVHARSFVEDYYYRVHVRPNRIDLGNTMSVQTREVEVWNAWFEANALADIVATNAEGMTLSGPSVPPTSFGPLESRIYVLSVTPNGPPVVNAAFRFDFALDAPVLRALGRRIVGWVFAPDWSEPVIERLEWMTDVMESHVGVEQRVRLRAEPRRSFEYRVLLGSDQARVQMENRLISWQARVYGLPVWTDASITAIAIPAGATSLAVSTANKDFVVGGIVGLVNGLRSEFAEITAVTANSVTLNDPIADDWPAGTKIVPVRSARVQNDLGVAYLTDAIAASRPQFQLEEEWPITPASESQDYLGYPVMLTPPNWTEDLEGRFGRKWHDLDYLTGRRVIDDLTGVAGVNRTHRWLLVGRAAVAAFRAWLAARAGKLKPFWLPSFQSDLAVVAPVGGTDAFLTVENRGYAEGPVAAVGRRDLLITTVSGARFYRRITAASEIDAASEMVAIDGTLGTTLQPYQFQRISFMHLVRLDTDNVEIAHVTDEVAEVVLPLRSLRDDL